jgi:hypothetical protein
MEGQVSCDVSNDFAGSCERNGELGQLTQHHQVGLPQPSLGLPQPSLGQPPDAVGTFRSRRTSRLSCSGAGEGFRIASFGPRTRSGKQPGCKRAALGTTARATGDRGWRRDGVVEPLTC